MRGGMCYLDVGLSWTLIGVEKEVCSCISFQQYKRGALRSVPQLMLTFKLSWSIQIDELLFELILIFIFLIWIQCHNCELLFILRQCQIHLHQPDFE